MTDQTQTWLAELERSWTTWQRAVGIGNCER